MEWDFHCLAFFKGAKCFNLELISSKLDFYRRRFAEKLSALSVELFQKSLVYFLPKLNGNWRNSLSMTVVNVSPCFSIIHHPKDDKINTSFVLRAY